ncbi:phosphoesterase [Clostridia bacterium]|nr:phosphoesterase [Clostridia bacterium]
MRILIFSDSHNDFENMVKVIKKIQKDIDLIIHLGDHYSDAMYIKQKFGIDTLAVSGNCDYAPNAPESEIYETEGKRIYITHGHNCGVKRNTDRLLQNAKMNNADIALFGHTHMPYLAQRDGLILLNPGSISQSRHDGPPTYGILNFEGAKTEPAVVKMLL